MELKDVFYSKEKTDRQLEYLFYNYELIESELFDSFTINPLRKAGLSIYSMFYANLCLRLYPLITIAFQTHTYNYSHKKRVEYWIEEKAKKALSDNITFEQILEKITEIRKKNISNEDYLGDYIRMHKNIDSLLWGDFSLLNCVSPKQHIGKIEYNIELQPFKKKYWGKFMDTRNELEHRGGTETRLEIALNGFACFHALLTSINNSQYVYVKWDSEIFSASYNPEC